MMHHTLDTLNLKQEYGDLKGTEVHMDKMDFI